MAYSEKERYKAVVLYRLYGNMKLVAQQTGIYPETLYQWRKQPWWDELEEEIRQESRTELTGKLKNIVEKSLKVLEDRLENGDWMYDPNSGKLVRKPVGAHVANTILGTSFDRALAIEKLAGEEKKANTNEQISDRLLKIAQEFEKFAKSKTIEGISHAIHDEREAGLQEGAEVGEHQAPATLEGPGGTPQGEGPARGGGFGEEGGQQTGGSQDPVVAGWVEQPDESPGSGGSREHVVPTEQGRQHEKAPEVNA